MRKRIHLLIAAILMVSAIRIEAQQHLDGIAAIVGNQIILVSEITALVTQYGLQNKVDVFKDQAQFRRLSQQFLQRLIDEKLLLIKAEEDTIETNEEQVEQTLEQQLKYMIQQAGSEENLEKYLGQPMVQIKREMRKEIENQLRIQMLRQKRFGDIKISRREVEDFYEEYADSLPPIEASVDISHILMQVKSSDESLRKALEKIQEVKKLLDEGRDFAQVAQKYSEDPGSASRGGDLGFVSRGDLVKEFEEVAFSLKEGEISDIVQTQFGFHIIQLIERRGDKIRVRHVLVQLQPTPEDEQRVINQLKEIRQKILDGEATLEEMALKYSDDPNVQKDHGHLGRYRVGAFQVKEFENAIRSLEPGEISLPFKTEFGYHIVQLNERSESRKMSLEKDWQQIEQWALESKRNKSYQKWLTELRKEIPIEIKFQL